MREFESLESNTSITHENQGSGASTSTGWGYGGEPATRGSGHSSASALSSYVPSLLLKFFDYSLLDFS